jgi:DNA-binding protein H-NS
MFMAKKTLTSLSVEALLKLRDDIGNVLSRKAESLKKELAMLGQDYKEVGRIAIYGRKKKRSLAGRKVPPKYRDPKSKATWAGRGAQPVWLRDALKAGRKLDYFLIEKPAKQTAANKRGKKKRARTPKARRALGSSKGNSAGAAPAAA